MMRWLLKEFVIKFLLIHWRRFNNLKIMNYSDKPFVPIYMLQKEIFQFLKLDKLYSTENYSEYININKITRYFTQGFLLCTNNINLCKHIIPPFMQDQFKQYFTQQTQSTNEILSFIEENKKIHELIAEHYMLQKLLE